jgi:hypothetical protein
MRRARWIAVVLVGTAACATVRGGTGRSADEGFSDGVRLLEAGDYARAAAVLDSVYQTYWTRPVGRRALLELAALSLDTRNPDRSLWQAADYSARLVAIPQTEPWLLPIGRTMYLTAVELGALEGERDEAVAARKDAEAAAGASRPLPRYQGETVPARLAALEQARDELRERVAGLEQQLRDTTQELARIRRTIKP